MLRRDPGSCGVFPECVTLHHPNKSRPLHTLHSEPCKTRGPGSSTQPKNISRKDSERMPLRSRGGRSIMSHFGACVCWVHTCSMSLCRCICVCACMWFMYVYMYMYMHMFKYVYVYVYDM